MATGQNQYMDENQFCTGWRKAVGGVQNSWFKTINKKVSKFEIERIRGLVRRGLLGRINHQIF